MMCNKIKNKKMGYVKRKSGLSRLTSVKTFEGEPIEWKLERATSNGEPISDGAPEIYTERKDGIISAYNIRTDRWEIAAEAMDKVSGSIQAKRDSKAKIKKEKVEEVKETKVVELKQEVSEAKPIQGKASSDK